MSRLVAVLVLVSIILPGLVQGFWTGRWGNPESLDNFAGRLAQIPLVVQEWDGENTPIDPRQIAEAGLTGYVSRRYRQRVSKNSVFVFVATGRPGPVSVHGPETCYEGQGYAITKEGIRTSSPSDAPGVADEFHNATFLRAGSGTTDILKIYWSWNANGRWQTPAHPRVAFGGYPGLYKLYVMYPYSQESQHKDADEICKGFLRVFLPELQKCLFLGLPKV